MYLQKIRFAFITLIFTISVAYLSSCSTPKNITYFGDLPDSGSIKSIQLPEFKTPLIQPDDILDIKIEVIDPIVTATVNQSTGNSPSGAGGSAQSTGTQSSSGYLVNKDGIVELPLMGKIKLSGLTTFEAADVVQKKASEFLKSPTVQVRFLNYKITVIGEVNRPAIYTVPNEKVSVMDAIGLAGDLTIYGKRENILVIHDDNGSKDFTRVNLNSSNVFQSPAYYLRQNDIVYVEPSKAKKATNNAQETRTLTIIISIASVLALILTRIKY